MKINWHYSVKQWPTLDNVKVILMTLHWNELLFLSKISRYIWRTYAMAQEVLAILTEVEPTLWFDQCYKLLRWDCQIEDLERLRSNEDTSTAVVVDNYSCQNDRKFNLYFYRQISRFYPIWLVKGTLQ